MKYIKRKAFQKRLPPITNTWEVRFSIPLWERIRKVAMKRKVTFSWVVRYCIFYQMYSQNPTYGMEFHSRRPKSHSKGEPIHRHLLCLYGEDEKLLRNSAMQAGMTVSAYIRMCVEMHLAKIEHITYAELFSKGIKLGKQYKVIRHFRYGIPSLILVPILYFSLEEWWKVPPGAKIPIAA